MICSVCLFNQSMLLVFLFSVAGYVCSSFFRFVARYNNSVLDMKLAHALLATYSAFSA
jgi:hypothetical protein